MPPAPTEAPPDVERRWLGHGLALRPSGPDTIGHDLVFVRNGDSRDLAPVSGAAGLAQDLAVALLTPPGSDPLNMDFGFDGLRVLTQDLTPPLVLEMLRLSALRTVSADPRVAEVLDLVLTETEPGTRRWQVDITVRTVLGSALTTTIGEVAADG
ncbi:hypothetical protein [Streptomyces rhizosphaericus]|uniref:IraD/Gp25-like domain-containing protein n=1 Tax=Streptomyces rhizosphaericus TaxID=114699 RepID=A0A6G4AAL2_9ACTN|nr:hypothetical protein [Streptomyces rhizosphaericus]NEW69884.1 hypothetical protein [Streptomyces rhizosphaericus]